MYLNALIRILAINIPIPRRIHFYIAIILVYAVKVIAGVRYNEFDLKS